MLGLALDLSLREKGLHLDDFMKLMWTNFGKQEIPYTVEDIHHTLKAYAGSDFGDAFFNHYIYKSDMPDMKRLLSFVGVSLTQDLNKIYFGASVTNGVISENTMMGSPAYKAGLENGDTIIKIGVVVLNDRIDFDTILNTFKPYDNLDIVYKRLGLIKETTVTLQASNVYSLSLFETNNLELSRENKANRASWLQAK